MSHFTQEDELYIKMRELPDFKMDVSLKAALLERIRYKKVKAERREQNKWLAIVMVSSVCLILLVVGYSIASLQFSMNTQQTAAKIPTSWELSPTFSKEITYPDGTVNVETFRGVEGKIAIPTYWDFVANDIRLPSKVVLSVFDHNLLKNANGERVSGFLEAKAIHKETGETISLTDEKKMATVVSAPKEREVYSPAHAVFEPFPYAGVWRIDFYINDAYYESVTLHVKKPYIKLANSELLISEEDMTVGKHEHVYLEIDGTGHGETISVKATDENGNEKQFSFHYQGRFWRANDKKEFSTYEGMIDLDHPGSWRIKVLEDEKTMEVHEKNL